MGKSVLIHIFKIAGALLVSLILWALFIGRPNSNVSDGSTVTLATYADRGSAFEEMIYTVAGGKEMLGQAWLEATGINGLQSELSTVANWDDCVEQTQTDAEIKKHSISFSGN